MTRSAPQTPNNLQMSSRDLHFDDPQTPRWWLNGDPVATAFFNALSASFPIGERYFIDAVKRFRDVDNAQLRDQIAVFITQESLHTREHLAFNRIATDAGYDFGRLDIMLKRRFAWARSRSPIEQLASTIALEHFTAILAHALLTDSSDFDGAPETVRRLWTWHAIEEIEHKAVAFDTFVCATRAYSRFGRWFLRTRVMAVSTLLFLHEILFGVAESFRQDKINTPRTWLRFLRYLFVSPGLFRRVSRPYLSYFRPGFHPWAVDDRALIKEFEPLVA
jgi:predicted metal-dependent hydrolase